MVSFLRTTTCGSLREGNVSEKVTLCGWVHRMRNLGGLLFLDLRDRYGVTQVLIDPEKNPHVYEIAESLRAEFVISVTGTVCKRQDPNERLATGKIEIIPDSLVVLSKAEVCPIIINDDKSEANEELRLTYRYLDMRRGKILRNLEVRHKAMMTTRRFLDNEGFIEVATPFLSKSTPEGSRDYLVPSRVNPGTFYALPQSPQIFKQLLMIGGLDRYFQIATCMRDEDLRADRQPEFAQIDLEMSFATQEELFPLIEGLVKEIFKVCKNTTIEAPFQRMTYDECMESYGCDKPDLRYGMTLKRLDALALKTTFGVFQTILEHGGCVKGLCVKDGVDISRKQIEGYTDFVSQLGIKGLAWIKLSDDGSFSSSLAKFISTEDQKSWIAQLEMEPKDVAFIIAGPKKQVHQGLDQLRRRLAKDRNLIKENSLKPLWVTDFPLFAFNDEENRLESEHHPFTGPHFEDISLLDSEPLKARSSSYDLVINGFELASGSQRIHDSDLQDTIFAILGMDFDERKKRFGFFVESLQYGTPPHIGIALGFDRLCMILSDTDSIRDVIAFPKTQKACCLMTQAPSEVTQEQLDELNIQIKMAKTT